MGSSNGFGQRAETDEWQIILNEEQKLLGSQCEKMQRFVDYLDKYIQKI